MLSIKNNDKYEYIIKNSRFISLIFRVYNKDEVTNTLNKIKKEYPIASHYCFGYIIDNDIRFNDDGEPNGTAGNPILKQIQINNLNYTLIVVVRYFGGIKLGAGPLTRAYAKAAKDVIKKENIIELVKGYSITITFNYDQIKNIDYLLIDSRVISKNFDKLVTYNTLVTKETLDKLSNYNITIQKETYLEK